VKLQQQAGEKVSAKKREKENDIPYTIIKYIYHIYTYTYTAGVRKAKKRAKNYRRKIYRNTK
jgi:hypothetical protein